MLSTQAFFGTKCDSFSNVLRGVAQTGSAPEWGSGGRWFKSSRPDQKETTLVDKQGSFFAS